jgi:hypothetical protein
VCWARSTSEQPLRRTPRRKRSTPARA